MVSAAQTATGNAIDWAPIAAELMSRGHVDEVDYVNEVVP